MKSKNLLFAVSLICALGVAPAMAHELTAPGSPSAQNEGKGATTGLGDSHRFPSTAAAQGHCSGNDPVVWSDGEHLTYDLAGSQGYGKGKGDYGFYACKSEADAAGFQGGQ